MTEVKIKEEFSNVKKHLLLILILMFLIVAEFVMLTNLSVYFCQISKKKNPVTLMKLLSHISPLDGAKVRFIPELI